MESKYLALWLEGPLQSWGNSSKFGVRSTLPFPTKSGLAGILLAAMGKGGPQEDLLAELAARDLQIFELEGAARPSTIVDYQVVGNGFKRDGWEGLMIPRKRDGGFAVGGGSKLTYRHYLQDAVFCAVMEIPAQIADEAAEGLIHPIWPICLGRRCCIPSQPVFIGVADTKGEAEILAMERIASRGMNVRSRVVEGAWPEKGEVYALSDVPVTFGDHKRYASRYVTRIEEEDGQPPDNQDSEGQPATD